jgi:hypothetical protein
LGTVAAQAAAAVCPPAQLLWRYQEKGIDFAHQRIYDVNPFPALAYTPKGDPEMAKVYGLHEIELRPGKTPEELKKLFAELANTEGYEGWTPYLLAGERGERKGKYLVMLEIESVEARDRYAPSEDGPFSEEAEALSSRNAALWERWRELATMPGEDAIFTDYVVVAQ